LSENVAEIWLSCSVIFICPENLSLEGKYDRVVSVDRSKLKGKIW